MKSILLLLSAVFSTAHADVGVGKIIKCSNSEMKFELFNTAVVTLKQGFMTAKVKRGQKKSKPIGFKCKAPAESKPTGADEIITHYECTEDRQGDQKWIVNILSGGQIGKFRAEVSIQQAFPLPPKAVFPLLCKDLTEELGREKSKSNSTH